MIGGVLITGLIGFSFIYLGIITLNGTYKRWYLGPRLFPPQAIVYATIPFGITFIELCLILLFTPNLGPDIAGWIIGFSVLPTALFGYVLAIWRPKWIKPYWVWWLEENYSHKIHFLIATARQDPAAWEKRVATQAGLEQWAREVAGEPQPKHRS